MFQTEALQISEKHKFIVAELQRRSDIAHSLSQDIFNILAPPVNNKSIKDIVLLQIAEGLIAAHKAAKHDNDGYTFNLIEDALKHVGKRLANEGLQTA